jgi:hypothetical protein
VKGSGFIRRAMEFTSVSLAPCRAEGAASGDITVTRIKPKS